MNILIGRRKPQTKDLLNTSPFPNWTVTRPVASLGNGARWGMTHVCGAEMIITSSQIGTLRNRGRVPKCGCGR